MKYLLTAGKFCKKRERETKELYQNYNNKLNYYRIKNAANTVLKIKNHLTKRVFKETGLQPDSDLTIKAAVETFLNMQNTPLLDALNVPVLGVRELLEG